jgi:hypothetical protein
MLRSIFVNFYTRVITIPSYGFPLVLQIDTKPPTLGKDHGGWLHGGLISSTYSMASRWGRGVRTRKG